MLEDRVEILGVPFVCATMNEMVETVHEHVKKEEKCFIVTANPEIVMKANQEKEYMEIIRHADYVTADGIGIVKAAQWLKKPLPERVAGYDMMIRFLELSNQHAYKVYLLGAKEEVLQEAVRRIRKQYPNVDLVGARNGYFQWEDSTIIDEIKEKQPDFIFVALGMGRQEKWIAEHMPHVQKGVFMGVGGSFDVLAGALKRAPEAWIRLHLEWLYRLLQQPSRAKRMMALPKFVLKVWREKVAKGK
ncbi:WecB/TagA/CpsF family glycosyltransferase [Thermolongibacillus altinsuensis]|jgi:N-acetylglucosaminyldiphosphoundecaprenol N-acetyl-beta-D-mannosaminyltransferase|uniref:WecB/TagA/CpsF family glycosyltransferase n=1 Tax=Thermolongibacillus altinsuensis TaxID=575256 RepID=UPI00242A2F4D|nr:WecB/TagA/CpsF family glycosyltransferase [Thermolongibacillus altinsuensis]GMB09352.1 acetylglucosaminyldiphosphoundecaprenol acetyl-beta-D-mannosaminyltransferase [Thermolongibacillus altinsuensis]